MSLSSIRISKIACSILLVLLVVPLSSVVVAQQEEEENSKQTSLSDLHTDTDDSSSLLTNYNAMRAEGQGFYLWEASVLFETPGSNTSVGVALHWWCDLEFAAADNATTTDNYGYVGRAVGYYLPALAIHHRLVVHGEHISFNNTHALSVSAVWVPTLGIFEVQIHDTQDDWVGRYWDNGRRTLPFLGWKGQADGVATGGGFAGTVTYTKITTKLAVVYLGRAVTDLTPATCSQEYAAAWNENDIFMATKRTVWFIQSIGMLVVTVIGLVAVDLF